jgi:hypothetical protein
LALVPIIRYSVVKQLELGKKIIIPKGVRFAGFQCTKKPFTYQYIAVEATIKFHNSDDVARTIRSSESIAG